MLLVLNDMLDFDDKLWQPSEEKNNWFLAKKYIFACGIKDEKYIKRYEAILAKYDIFWSRFTSQDKSPFENEKNLNYDVIFKSKINFILKDITQTKTEHTWNDVPIHACSWLFPYLAFSNLKYFINNNEVRNNRIYLSFVNNFINIVTKDKNQNELVIPKDTTKFKYEVNVVNFLDVSFQTNEFFDLNNLLVDRIFAGNFTEEDIINNLPCERIIFPQTKTSKLCWPLADDQFKNQDVNDEKQEVKRKEFDSIKTQILFQTNQQNINNILNQNSLCVLAYLVTLFYISNETIPNELYEVIKNKNHENKKQKIFFKRYVDILILKQNNNQIITKDIYDMISNKNYLIRFKIYLNGLPSNTM